MHYSPIIFPTKLQEFEAYRVIFIESSIGHVRLEVLLEVLQEILFFDEAAHLEQPFLL